MSSRAWPAVLAVAALLVACNPTGPSASGTKTEWFRVCEASEDCPNDTECLCGICTIECSSDDACRQGACSPEESPPQCEAEAEVDRICLPIAQIPFSTPDAPTELSITGATSFDDPSFTDDRLELYFSALDSTGVSQIWTSTRSATAEPWGEPALVPELNLEDGSSSMSGVTSDGLTHYYVHNRDVGPRLLYVAGRSSRAAEWSMPEPLSIDGEWVVGDSPSGTSDGLLLAWSSKVGSFSEIFLAERETLSDPWESLGVLEELSGVGNYEPWLSDDGLTLFFRRHDDIYTTSRESQDAPFQEPTLVEEISTTAADGDPWLTQDTRHIMFASEGDDGAWLLFEASR